MVPYSKRRKGRHRWRFFLGLSVLGLLIVASASHAGIRPLVTGGASTDEALTGRP